jgi:hypothetical protein
MTKHSNDRIIELLRTPLHRRSLLLGVGAAAMSGLLAACVPAVRACRERAAGGRPAGWGRRRERLRKGARWAPSPRRNAGLEAFVALDQPGMWVLEVEAELDGGFLYGDTPRATPFGHCTLP